MPDNRFNIASFAAMSSGASQSTIDRRGDIRLRFAVLTGTTDSGDTRVFVEHIKDPVVVWFNCIIENSGTTDSWQGMDFGKSAPPSANLDFGVRWDGPNHGTASIRNSFIIEDLGTGVQSSSYRIMFAYLEREP